jgi:hypothetical protein
MPAPLNTRSGYVNGSALVIIRGDDYNRLFAAWNTITSGQLAVVYASEVPAGFAIPANLSGQVQLILPPPKFGAIDPAKLGTITLDVCEAGGATKKVTFVTT